MSDLLGMRNPCSLIRVVLLLFIFWGCEKDLKDSDVLNYEEFLNEVKVDERLNTASKYLVVMGDIQEYTGYPDYYPYYSFLLKTMAWTRKQYDEYNNIVGVLQLGDITWANLEEQWDRYLMASKYIDEKLPILICTGNHDYNWTYIGETPKIYERSSTRINNYSPNSPLIPLIRERYEENSIENYIASLEIDDKILNIVVLEFGPRVEVIDWLEEILMEHSDEKFLIMTHEYICYGEIPGRDSYTEWHFKDTSSTYSTPQEISSRIIKKYSNVIGILCGHNGFYEHYHTALDERTISTSVLFNLQYQDNGGNGLIQLWEFPENENMIKVDLYNTISNEFVDSHKYSFNINF